jgi:hypothetical protein
MQRRNPMNQLLAFHLAQDLLPQENRGHYDAETQMWIGASVSEASDSTDGLTLKNPTGTITFPIIPDADADLDWV